MKARRGDVCLCWIEAHDLEKGSWQLRRVLKVERETGLVKHICGETLWRHSPKANAGTTFHAQFIGRPPKTNVSSCLPRAPLMLLGEYGRDHGDALMRVLGDESWALPDMAREAIKQAIG